MKCYLTHMKEVKKIWNAGKGLKEPAVASCLEVALRCKNQIFSHLKLLVRVLLFQFSVIGISYVVSLWNCSWYTAAHSASFTRKASLALEPSTCLITPLDELSTTLAAVVPHHPTTLGKAVSPLRHVLLASSSCPFQWQAAWSQASAHSWSIQLVLMKW